MISDLVSQSSFPWLIGGDMNEIFYNLEKKGGPPKSLCDLDSFRKAFIDNGLFDIGYFGYDFTWSN